MMAIKPLKTNKYSWRVVLVVALLGTAGAVPGAEIEAISAPNHERGRKIYNFRCYYCHGYSGDARTLASTYLNPPPASFQALSPEQRDRETMIEIVQHGCAGTAMPGFGATLDTMEIEAVVDFVRAEFMIAKARNTRYHTDGNGWPNHERYRAAFPFATGEIALDIPVGQLTPAQRTGRKLFMAACITCHDRARVVREGRAWEEVAATETSRAVPPAAPARVETAHTPCELHHRPPRLAGLTEEERRGETLYQKNCAFCHAPDGSGRNWIGSFLQPNPRNLTDRAAMADMTWMRLETAIKNGLPNTSMPAWRAVLTDAQIAAIIRYVSRAFHPVPDDRSP